ncbi:hypothetical protein CS8_085590 [Cupriavidus sp. 8B]
MNCAKDHPNPYGWCISVRFLPSLVLQKVTKREDKPGATMKSKRWEGCTRLLRYLHACAESRRSHLATKRWGSDSLAGPLISRRGWPVNAYYRGTQSSTCSTQINRVARRSRDAEQFRAPSPGGHFSHASGTYGCAVS